MIAEDVRELIELFNQSDLTELSIEQHGRRLFLRKSEGTAGQEQVANVPDEPQLTPIKAHLVGTFYWSADKAAKPAVALHQHIDKGQVIGLIESMGIMNEIEAAYAGRVVEIAAASSQPVEYGQTVLVLEPDPYPGPLPEREGR